MHRPPAIRTDDTNPFARDTMHRRVPAIARDTLARHPDAPPRVRAAVLTLADAIERGDPIPPLAGPGDDVDAWNDDVRRHAEDSWLATEWFFAETYFYRCLLDAFRYPETGRDPFRAIKEDELAAPSLWERQLAALEARSLAPAERLTALLDASLWGNRVDLSYAESRAHGSAATDDDLLVDDRARVAAFLADNRGEIHLVADNTGTELAVDYVLVAALLDLGVTRVCLHVKRDPTFVSDATPPDVWRLLEAMRARGGDHAALAAALDRAFLDERLRLLPDRFWNGPRFYDRLPPRLARRLTGASVVIVKGDANYRRVVGDTMWPEPATFDDACAELPAPFVCLRTMKSDPLVGVPDARVATLDRADPRWRVNGRRGVVQAARL